MLLAGALAVGASACSGSGGGGGGGGVSHQSASPGRPLTPAEAQTLVTDGERRLAEAYAAGDASHLPDFLAGPQLRGNAGTIAVLNGRHQRNVFHIVVDSASIMSGTGDRTVVAVHDHTTDNAFVDTTTGQTLNSGLPGPEVQSFVLFFDRNPHDGRWYWTGAQKQSQ
jgi:hypothetical protein